MPRFAVNGQMLRVNFQIDGNTNTQKDRAGLRLMPMSEVMIQEVQIVSAGYAPEFGQTTGMVYNAVTPSGTNKMRGDVGYRFRTKDFAACPFSTNTTLPGRPVEPKPDNSLKIVDRDVRRTDREEQAVLLLRLGVDAAGTAAPRDDRSRRSRRTSA